MILDVLGSSEAGRQATSLSMPGEVKSSVEFDMSPGAHILNEPMDNLLKPGSSEIGWLPNADQLADYIDHLQRGPNGKPDAKWAKALVSTKLQASS